jgi:hypothetical protein
MLPGAVLAQAGKPQFKQPQLNVTGGRVTSFVTGVTQTTSSLSDIIYVNAATGAAPNSSILVGELLNAAGDNFYNLGQNQITFPNVSNVVTALADFNGDGNLDYAFALTPTVAGGPNLCVYYGSGATVLSGSSSYNGPGPPPTYYPPSTSGKSGCIAFATTGTLTPNFAYVAALPFKPRFVSNLLIEDSANNLIYILANSGASGSNGLLPAFSLKPTISLPAGTSAGPVYIGDFNNDGFDDFILNDQTSHSALLYLGNGDGTFQAPKTLLLQNSTTNVSSMLVQDMDGDGIPDLVVETNASLPGVIQIFKGHADGTFSPTSEGGTSSSTSAYSGLGGHLVAIDPNTLNILTTTPVGLSVLTAPKGPLSYTLQSIYNIGPGRSSFALLDFFGTNQLDLAVDSPEGVAIALADTNSDGGFQTSKAYSALSTALSSTVGLFRNTANNPKGNVDVVVSDGSAQGYLLTGNGDGTFNSFGFTNPTGTTPANVPPGVWSNIFSGDFDGDGNQDVLYSFTGEPQPAPTGTVPLAYIQYGNGDGTFAATGSTFNVTVPGGSSNDEYAETAIADVNGDGISDFAMSDPLLSGVAPGTKARPSSFPSGFAVAGTGEQFSPVATGFIKATRLNKQDLIFQRGGLLIPYLNDGTGTNFIAEPALAGSPSTSLLTLSAVLLTDIDNDGNGDVVALYYNPAVNSAKGAPVAPCQLYIWWGNGDGTFSQTPQVVNLVRNDTLAAVGDMNRDGLPDILLADGSVVTVLYNQGSRIFKSDFLTCEAVQGANCGEQHFLAGQGVNSLSVADVNGDGSPDLIVANGGAAISNPLALGGATQSSISLPQNPDINSGGITVLLNNYLTKPVTGTLVATPEPSAYQATFTLTATLTPTAGVALPTGTVTFYIDGVTNSAISFIPVVVGTATSTASVTIPMGNGYAVGVHPIQATYGGDAANSSLTLNGGMGKHFITNSTTTTNMYLCMGPAAGCPAPPAVVSPTPPYSAALTMYYGQTWNGILDAIANDGTALTGTVALDDVYNGGAPAVICTVPVNGGACPATVGVSTAAGSTTGAQVGVNMLTAAYSGDSTHAGSTSPLVTVTVLPDTVTATLSGSPNPSPLGQPVTFTATFTGNYAAPTGTANFTYTTSTIPTITPLGTAPLVPGPGLTSTATFTTSALPLGTDRVTVGNVATLDFATGVASTNEIITAALPGTFALSVSPNPASVGVGNSSGLTVTVSALNGFNFGVNLACANLPAEMSCTFLNSTLTPGATTPGSTTLFVGTSAPHACGTTQPYFTGGNHGGPGLMPVALPSLAGLLALLLPGRRRWLRMLVAIVAVATAMQVTGCGNCTDLGNRPGTYTFQVTGTSTGTSEVESQTVTLNVTL